MTRRGRRGTRGLSTILFALNTLNVLGSYADRFSTYLTLISDVAEWGVALAAVIMLWQRPADRYFAELQRARELTARRHPGGPVRPGAPGAS
jgi:hypothetical protein